MNCWNERCRKVFTSQRSTARFCCGTCRVQWSRDEKKRMTGKTISVASSSSKGAKISVAVRGTGKLKSSDLLEGL